MTKEEFRARWGGPTDPSDITFNDIAECAVEWEVESKPKTKGLELVLYKVLVAAEVPEAENYRPLMDEVEVTR